jgi:hypothetical protein
MLNLEVTAGDKSQCQTVVDIETKSRADFQLAGIWLTVGAIVTLIVTVIAGIIGYFIGK